MGDGAGESEVQHANPAVLAPHRIGRLEIVMHQAGVMGGRQAPSCLYVGVTDVAPVGTLVGHPPGQGLAFHQLQHEEDPALGHKGRDIGVGGGLGSVVATHIVDLDHVLVGQRGQGVSLGEPSLVGSRISGHGLHELDRDGAVELRIVGSVDDPHPSGGQPLEQQVTGELRSAVSSTEQSALESSEARGGHDGIVGGDRDLRDAEGIIAHGDPRIALPKRERHPARIITTCTW